MFQSNYLSLFLFSCLFLCFFPSSSAQPPSQELLGTAALDSNYHISWRVQFPGNDLFLHIKVLGNFGWVGFGFGEETSGSMPGADLFTISFDENGSQPKIQDRYSTEFGLPKVDKCQDYTLLSFNRNQTGTFVEVTRKLDTGDLQDRVVGEGPRRVLFAYGGPGENTVNYHGARRGATVLQFIPPPQPPPVPPPGTLSASFVMENVTLPDFENVYICQSYTFPTGPSKSHIIQLDPVLDPQTLPYTHHMLVGICRTKSPYFDNFLTPGICGEKKKKRQDASDRCVEYMFVWAVGMKSLVLPPEAGFPMGTQPGEIQYVVLQVHFNNPQKKPGLVVHQTGFRIHFTPQGNLRQYDAGVMVLGDLGLSLPSIPPQDANVEYEVTCPEECTRTWPHRIHVFADVLHMHFIGHKLWTNLWRKNQFVQTMNSVEYFNYNLQQATNLNVTVEPGDRMNTHCVFDSTPRDQTTDFGIASTDEMCLDFLFYFPRIQGFSTCGYFPVPTPHSLNSTICGDFTNVLPIQNPSIPDPKGLPRPGEFFGQPCNGTETPFNGDEDEGIEGGQMDGVSGHHHQNQGSSCNKKGKVIPLIPLGIGIGLLVVSVVVALVVAIKYFQRRREYQPVKTVSNL